MKTKRRYGIEIEISRQLLCVNNLDRKYGPAWSEIQDMLNSLYSDGKIVRGWRLKVDTSCGGEIVSPILKGPSGIANAAIICEGVNKIAKKYNLPSVDSECGLHIHLDAQNISAPQLSNLFIILHSSEPIIYAMYTARSPEYCAPISINMKLASKLRDWTDVRDTWYRPSNNVKNPNKSYSSAFINGTSSGEMYDGTRYHGFNIHCYWRQGTVEFRYGGGTTDVLMINAYYEMCVAILNKAMSSTKVDSSNSIKEMEYTALVSHYRSGVRFRKMIKKFVKDCSLTPNTTRMIMESIRKSNPNLLNKSPKGKVIINADNCYGYYFSLDGEFYDNSGRKISNNRLSSFMQDKNLKPIEVELDYTNVLGNKVGIMPKSKDFVIQHPIYISRLYKTRVKSLRAALGEPDDDTKKTDESVVTFNAQALEA